MIRSSACPLRQADPFPAPSGKHRDRRSYTTPRDMISPSAGVIDSQSVKTTESGGVRGFDAGKKIKGRKRHIVVDTLGLLVGVVVQAADIQDRYGAPAVLKSILERWPWLRHVFADGGYAGPKLRGALQKIGKFTSASSLSRSSSGATRQKASKSCRAAGSFSGPSHGWADAEGWPRTSSDPSNPHRPGSSSQTSACSPDGSQGPENTALVPIQTLRKHLGGSFLPPHLGAISYGDCCKTKRSN